MILGDIKTIDSKSWTYSFLDINWNKKQEIFEIINLKEQSNLEKKYFAEFWGAMSPYEKWEKIRPLKITDSLLKLNNVTWYIMVPSTGKVYKES